MNGTIPKKINQNALVCPYVLFKMATTLQYYQTKGPLTSLVTSAEPFFFAFENSLVVFNDTDSILSLSIIIFSLTINYCLQIVRCNYRGL